MKEGIRGGNELGRDVTYKRLLIIVVARRRSRKTVIVRLCDFNSVVGSVPYAVNSSD